MLAAAPRKEALLERKARILLTAGRTDDARHTFEAALTAIESLSPNQRHVKATAKLEATIREQLAP